MRATHLNRRIGLQMPTRAPNGQGGYTKGWTDTLMLWAQLIPLRGQEAQAHNLATSAQLWKVTIRWRPGVTPDCRLMLDEMPLNVRTAQDPDGKRQWIVMTAESGVKT